MGLDDPQARQEVTGDRPHLGRRVWRCVGKRARFRGSQGFARKPASKLDLPSQPGRLPLNPKT